MVLSDFLLSFLSPTPAPNTLVLQIDAIFFCTHDRRPVCIGPRFPLLSPDFFLQETLQSEESYLLPRAPSADALGRLLAWKPVDFSRSTAGLLVGFVDCLCLCLIRGYFSWMGERGTGDACLSTTLHAVGEAPGTFEVLAPLTSMWNPCACK